VISGILSAGAFSVSAKVMPGGQRLEQRGAAVLALQALVALHAAVGGVAGFALFEAELHAVDAAAGVDQLEVVHMPLAQGVPLGA
jgi:hypothetical protein